MQKNAKLIRIGNSQGVRLPKSMISRYGLGDQVVLEEVGDGILIHATDQGKLSWEDTYKQMAGAEQSEWSDWEGFDVDLERHL